MAAQDTEISVREMIDKNDNIIKTKTAPGVPYLRARATKFLNELPEQALNL